MMLSSNRHRNRKIGVSTTGLYNRGDESSSEEDEEDGDFGSNGEEESQIPLTPLNNSRKRFQSNYSPEAPSYSEESDNGWSDVDGSSSHIEDDGSDSSPGPKGGKNRNKSKKAYNTRLIATSNSPSQDESDTEDNNSIGEDLVFSNKDADNTLQVLATMSSVNKGDGHFIYDDDDESTIDGGTQFQSSTLLHPNEYAKKKVPDFDDSEFDDETSEAFGDCELTPQKTGKRRSIQSKIAYPKKASARPAMPRRHVSGSTKDSNFYISSSDHDSEAGWTYPPPTKTISIEKSPEDDTNYSRHSRDDEQDSERRFSFASKISEITDTFTRESTRQKEKLRNEKRRMQQIEDVETNHNKQRPKKQSGLPQSLYLDDDDSVSQLLASNQNNTSRTDSDEEEEAEASEVSEEDEDETRRRVDGIPSTIVGKVNDNVSTFGDDVSMLLNQSDTTMDMSVYRSGSSRFSDGDDQSPRCKVRIKRSNSFDSRYESPWISSKPKISNQVNMMETQRNKDAERSDDSAGPVNAGDLELKPIHQRHTKVMGLAQVPLLSNTPGPGISVNSNPASVSVEATKGSEESPRSTFTEKQKQETKQQLVGSLRTHEPFEASMSDLETIKEDGKHSTQNSVADDQTSLSKSETHSALHLPQGHESFCVTELLQQKSLVGINNACLDIKEQNKQNNGSIINRNSGIKAPARSTTMDTYVQELFQHRVHVDPHSNNAQDVLQITTTPSVCVKKSPKHLEPFENSEKCTKVLAEEQPREKEKIEKVSAEKSTTPVTQTESDCSRMERGEVVAAVDHVLLDFYVKQHKRDRRIILILSIFLACALLLFGGTAGGLIAVLSNHDDDEVQVTAIIPSSSEVETPLRGYSFTVP